MLDHLHQKAAQTLASTRSVILSSCGPADIQSSSVCCAARDLILYVYLPYLSDHLLNLEYRPEIAVTADAWDLHGTARILARDEIPAAIHLLEDGIQPNQPASGAYSPWGYIVEIRPTRLNLHSPSGQGNLETIDFETFTKGKPRWEP